MCGIYGAVSDCPNEDKLLMALCALNAQRGDQSSGVAMKISETQSSIFKRVMHPGKFCKKIPRYVNSVKHMTVLGHTRWSTHGAINKQNAHPFKVGKVVGTHNGVVSNVKEMQDFLACSKYEVDSQYLIHSLATKGNLGVAHGSLNVAYFVEEDNFLLHLIRYNNPLAIAFVNNDKGLVYSSDIEHLEEAIKWCKIDAEIYKVTTNCKLDFFKQENGEIGLLESDVEFDSTRKEYASKTMGFCSGVVYDDYEDLYRNKQWSLE